MSKRYKIVQGCKGDGILDTSNGNVVAAQCKPMYARLFCETLNGSVTRTKAQDFSGDESLDFAVSLEVRGDWYDEGEFIVSQAIMCLVNSDGKTVLEVDVTDWPEFEADVERIAEDMNYSDYVDAMQPREEGAD